VAVGILSAVPGPRWRWPGAEGGAAGCCRHRRAAADAGAAPSRADRGTGETGEDAGRAGTRAGGAGRLGEVDGGAGSSSPAQEALHSGLDVLDDAALHGVDDLLIDLHGDGYRQLSGLGRRQQANDSGAEGLEPDAQARC
jgi:hypothetical protein